MIRKIGIWLLIFCMLAAPAAMAETTTAVSDTAASTTTKAALIPETVDVGALNDFKPLEYWPWRSLEIRTHGSDQPALVDILVENETLSSPWQGIDDRRLLAEGLMPEEIAPLMALAPQGWGGLLTRQHDQGEIVGSMVWHNHLDGWYFERFLPETLRLAIYLPQKGEGFVTEPLAVRQYNGLIEVDLDTREARVLTNTFSGLWLMKLALRLVIAAGLTILAILPVIDKGRGWIALIKFSSSLFYLLLAVLLPGLFSQNYVLALCLTQLLLSAAEAALVYYMAADKQIKPAIIYGIVSLGVSLVLGIWWMA